MKKTNANATMITNIIKKATGRKFSNKEIYMQPVISHNNGRTMPLWAVLAAYLATGVYCGALIMKYYNECRDADKELAEAEEAIKRAKELREKWSMSPDEDPYSIDEDIHEVSENEVPEDIRARIEKMRNGEEEVEDPLVAAIKRWRKA